MWGPQRILSSSVFLTLPRTWVGQLHNGTTGTAWSGDASVKCSDPASKAGASGLVLLSCEELPKGRVFAELHIGGNEAGTPGGDAGIRCGGNTGESLLWAAAKPPAYMCSEEEPLSRDSPYEKPSTSLRWTPLLSQIAIIKTESQHWFGWVAKWNNLQESHQCWFSEKR